MRPNPYTGIGFVSKKTLFVLLICSIVGVLVEFGMRHKNDDSDVKEMRTIL